MGQARAPQPVKLIIPMLAHKEQWFARATEAVVARLGAIDWESEQLPFSATDYYAPEMGAPQWRRFVTLAELIDPGALPRVKTITNEIEQSLALEGRRRINLDPGYVSLAKLVLATTKNQWHRLYLGEGIYGEVTLRYHHGAWQALPWTYPDYASQEYARTLAGVRTRYHAQLKGEPTRRSG